ncbi:MAG: hypothetical protein M9921_05335 [Fimbriimonadaceae bacterium]|nr:hypothetical protein [Chthonomonadaceae bacterium]MCO5296263.1 hypothetical protein [Fimbriimonadaceae bacterium]
MLLALVLLATTFQNPLKDAGTFPIAVWLQDPGQATRYKSAGINLYVGLWQGPTEEQLAALKKAGMPVVCDQNAVGLRHLADPTIVAWMHGDEPDNAQAVIDPATGKQTWGPCVPPARIVADYRRLKSADPSRPVLLNLGQGVANDAWKGRGNGAKLDDYKTYVQGSDIVSFDVYPVAGVGEPLQLGLVAKGVDRLKAWADDKKRIWTCLECTDIGAKGKATPAQVKAEAWSAIIHGARGLIYFVHQFQPKFNEHALLDDPEMLAAVTSLNKQIQRYALRLGNVRRAGVMFDNGIHSWASTVGGNATLFAVSLEDHPVTAVLQLPAELRQSVVEEIEEGRMLSLYDGRAAETFAPYQVHIYRIGAR